MQIVDSSRISSRSPRARSKLAVLLAAALAAGSLWFATPAGADADGINAEVQAFLATQLAQLPVAGRTEVLVYGTDITTAWNAVSASGLKLITTFDKIGVAVARGTAAQIRAAGNRRGISYLEATPRSATRRTPLTPRPGAPRRWQPRPGPTAGHSTVPESRFSAADSHDSPIEVSIAGNSLDG